MEASLRVDPQRLAAAMGDWLIKRGKGNGKKVEIAIGEL